MNRAQKAEREPCGIAYLRVSTKRQLDTAADIDPDGNSIGTQRDVCARKAVSLRVPIVAEFVEPGHSAQSIEKRPVFTELLAYLALHPEVTHVFIYQRSRAFRNYVDAGVTERALRERGVALVSAKEDFGDGIWGDAMKAVVDIMNEVQVRMSAEDIRIKMRNKAANGGTVGRAKLGYLNTREFVDGREIRSIGVDPDRAPLITLAFELASTGEYNMTKLADTLERRGLTMRPAYGKPARPLPLPSRNSGGPLLRRQGRSQRRRVRGTTRTVGHLATVRPCADCAVAAREPNGRATTQTHPLPQVRCLVRSVPRPRA